MMVSVDMCRSTSKDLCTSKKPKVFSLFSFFLNKWAMIEWCKEVELLIFRETSNCLLNLRVV